MAVVQQAYVEGVSIRRVDDLVKPLGCDGISKSQVHPLGQLLALPGALVGGAPVLIALAVICGLMSGGLWLYRRRQANLQ